MASDKSALRTLAGVKTAVIPFLETAFRKTWRGQANVRQGSGIIVVSNHLTVIDPLIIGHFLVAEGYFPHYLAKDSMFSWPVVGRVMKLTGQVPVVRGSADAAKSIEAAQKIVEDPESALIVFPEGTLTKDPELWPMRGYTGAARLALATGAPVVPIVHWGDHKVFPTSGVRRRPAFRPELQVTALPPVDLDDLRSQPVTKALLEEATDRIMSAITAELESIRGEKAPAVRFDPRKKQA